MSENSSFDLAKLLHPVSPTTLFEEYWEEKPLFISRNRPNYYTSLVSLKQVDTLVTVLSPDTVTLTNSDAPLEVGEFARADTSVADTALDVVRACQLFAGGATIMVRDAHKRLGPLAALCRTLEREIGAPFQTNLYLTPSHGKGFDTHYDTHDVFLLQIAGSKEWTIFDSPVRLPLSGQPFDPNVHSVGAATLCAVVHAGDFLYIPRGFLHHGRSGGETSLHATFGILSYRWADVLLEVMAHMCLSDPAFRRALPLGLGRPDFDTVSARRTFADLMSRAIAQASPDRVLDRLADEFVVSRRALVPGQLEQVSLSRNLSAMDEVGARPATIYRLQTEGDRIRIRSHGREISLPAETAETVRFALENERYSVRDLPGGLDEEAKLIIVKRLIEEGLVWKLAGC